MEYNLKKKKVVTKIHVVVPVKIIAKQNSLVFNKYIILNGNLKLSF